jgi:hypothetical protein
MTARTLYPWLRREHEQWLEEFAEALGPAERAGAGPWARWSALRYLETTFPERVERERQWVRAVAPQLTEPQLTRLWALGELLDVFPAYLGRLIGLCHRAGEFTTLTARLRDALAGWCRAVEDDLGPLPASAVPAKPREARATEAVPAEAVAVG